MEILRRSFKDYGIFVLLVFLSLCLVDVLEQQLGLDKLYTSMLSILTTLVVDFIIGYKLVRGVETDRLRNKHILGINEFNAEYFDLYWSRSIQDYKLIAKLSIASLLFFRIINVRVIPSGELGIVGSILNVAILVIYAHVITILIFAFFLKKQDNIDDLMFEKQLDYSSYSSDEIKIIKKHRLYCKLCGKSKD